MRGLRDAGPSLPTKWAGRKPLIAHYAGGACVMRAPYLFSYTGFFLCIDSSARITA